MSVISNKESSRNGYYTNRNLFRQVTKSGLPHLMANIEYKKINTNIRRSLNKFPDFIRMGTFIDSTHMKL